jgi:hypothetical protein
LKNYEISLEHFFQISFLHMNIHYICDCSCVSRTFFWQLNGRCLKMSQVRLNHRNPTSYDTYIQRRNIFEKGIIFLSWSPPGLPDFSRHNVPKREKYTKWPQHISSFNSHKIYQLAVKWTKWQLNIPTSYIARLSKIYPNLDFWFKN